VLNARDLVCGHVHKSWKLTPSIGAGGVFGKTSEWTSALCWFNIKVHLLYSTRPSIPILQLKSDYNIYVMCVHV
jgi:hypothetical protein